jgi:Amt family ammonium transporter
MKKIQIATLTLLTLFNLPIQAQTTAPTIDTGDTAWVLVSTALVLFMSIPGLALFYGGLVRRKNVLSVFMQIFILVAAISVEWVILGYSNAFGSNSIDWLKPFIGGFDWAFLQNISINELSPYFISHYSILTDGSKVGTIPHIVFILFQGMFAVITPALIIGAFAERINFKGFLIFSILWAIFIYNPIAHWVWSADGWLYKMGTLDFAGGIVVHVSAGVAAITTAILLGKRRDYKGHALPPHNIPQVAIGTGMLWVGWFGFNGGSGLAADGLAGNSLFVTHISASVAALTWAALEWKIDKRPTVVGICTGAIAGLATITGASGFVSVQSAIIIGFSASVICFLMVAYMKPKLGYDDSLDAFGVHGIGGIIGVILTGVFASPLIQSNYSGAFYGNFHQLWIQILATVTTVVFSGLGTFILFKITDKLVGVRVNDKHEAIGLDETQHGETAYTNFD